MKFINLTLIIIVGLFGLVYCGTFRPPSVPLIVHDPYVSIWSPNDHLYDDWPQHWAGGINALVSMVSVDSKCFRLMGPGI
jgi:hypothetical protein